MCDNVKLCTLSGEGKKYAISANGERLLSPEMQKDLDVPVNDS